MRTFIRLFFIFLALARCTGENVEDEIEVSCSSASGLWTISSVLCNGSPAADVGLVYLLFNADGSVSQTEGISECASTFHWNFLLGTDSPTLAMSGQGNISCSVTGESTTSCSHAANSCNSQIDFTGITNNYDTCVIANGSMSFARTVSAINNPDELSYCQNGQKEEVKLSKATDINLTPAPEPGSILATLAISGPNPIDFGTVGVGRSRTIAIRIDNTGKAKATAMSVSGLSLPYKFKGGTYPGTGGTCARTIAAESSCTLYVEFSPTAVGSFNDVFQARYFDSKKNQTLNHSLVGVGSQSLAVLAISNGPFYDFGNVTLGNSKSHTFTLTNSGGGAANSITGGTLSAPFEYAGGTFPGISGTCGTTLAAGANCTIVVDFVPSAAGTFNSSVRINYNDGSMGQSASRNTFGSASP